MFVDAPLGHTSGPPGDAALQRRIVEAALEHAVTAAPGEIMHLPLRWHHDKWRHDPLSWSRHREDAGAGSAGEQGGDTRTPRSDEPRYQNEADRAAAEQTDEATQCLTCLGLPPN